MTNIVYSGELQDAFIDLALERIEFVMEFLARSDRVQHLDDVVDACGDARLFLFAAARSGDLLRRLKGEEPTAPVT